MKTISKKRLVSLIGAAILSSSFFGCGKPSNDLAGISAINGGCIPVNQNIPFTALNAYVDTNNIRAGTLPGYNYGMNQSIGTVTLGGNQTGGSYGRQSRATGSTVFMSFAGSQQYAGAGVLPGAYQNNGYSGYGQQATISGYLQLTDSERNAIVQTMQTYLNNGMYQYSSGGINLNNGNQSSVGVCVSSIAINFQYYGANLAGGEVYLYLNNNLSLPPHRIQF